MLNAMCAMLQVRQPDGTNCRDTGESVTIDGNALSCAEILGDDCYDNLDVGQAADSDAVILDVLTHCRATCDGTRYRVESESCTATAASACVAHDGAVACDNAAACSWDDGVLICMATDTASCGGAAAGEAACDGAGECTFTAAGAVSDALAALGAVDDADGTFVASWNWCACSRVFVAIRQIDRMTKFDRFGPPAAPRT